MLLFCFGAAVIGLFILCLIPLIGHATIIEPIDGEGETYVR